MPKSKRRKRGLRLRRDFLVITWLAVCWLSQPHGAGATSSPDALNLAELTTRAERIFLGEVLSRTTGQDPLGHPATVYTFTVEQRLKGSVSDTITIKQIGVAEPVQDPNTGVITFPIDGIPVYEPGYRYLLFLNGTSTIGFTSPVGGAYGAFAVSADGQAVNGLNNAGLLRGKNLASLKSFSPRVLQHKRGPMSLPDLMAATARLVETAPATQPALASEPSLQSLHRITVAQPVPLGNITSLRNGHPRRWNIPSAENPGGTLSAIPYDVETGTLGSASNAAAVAKVAESFAKWPAPSTTSLVVTNTPGNLGVDVDANCPSPTCYLNWYFVFGDGKSPIIFDNDGSIINAITGNPCTFTGMGGVQGTTADSGVTWTLEGTVLFNGAFLGGVCANGTLDDVGGGITHEVGHFLGLAHTIVNGELVIAGESFLDFGVPPCSSVELMLSIANMRSVGCTRPHVLQKDDVSSISSLYPSANFAATTGKITGNVFAPDGATPVNCGNMILRNLNDPFFDAVATITGITKDSGSTPPPGQDGSYRAPGLTLGASYIVGVNQIPAFATGGRLITALCDPIPTLPGPEEFYNGTDESSDANIDNPACFTPVTAEGSVANIDIILNTSSSSTAPCSGQFALTVVVAGAGSGTLTSSPAGINCPSTCLGNYSEGMLVTLIATPTGNSLFAGWSGGCSGRGTCMVTMNRATTVTATFVLPLTLAALSLPPGEVGVAYNAPLVTGGLASYTVTLTKGVFPPGLSGNAASGRLTGTPTPSKGGRFTVHITDQLGSSVTGAFKIKILAGLRISTKSLNAGTHGKAYKGALKATGGKTPYGWSLVSGNLPTGLTLNSSTGAITGTPSTMGTFNPTFKVTDTIAGAATKALTLVIN